MKYFNLVIGCSLFSMLLGVTGCNSEDFVSLLAPPKSETQIANKDHQQSWRGEAKGYVSATNTVSNDVEYLIRLARITAAVDSYKKFALESRRAKTSVMEVFWKIEAVSSLGAETREFYTSVTPRLDEKNIQSIENELTELALPESISALANNNYEKRFAKRAIEKKLDSIAYRLSEDAFESHSVNDVMLANSAILREAGQIMQQAVSAEGVVLDQALLIRATSLLEASKALKLADNSSYCAEQVKNIFPLRHKIGQLEKKLSKSNFNEINETDINAGDVYQLAGEAMKIAQGGTESFVCSRPILLSQID